MAISVILALMIAVPIASGQSSSKGQNLPEKTAAWWNWAIQDPSPMEGSYNGGPKSEGYVDGVFFLAGSTTVDPVSRTVTVPARTPILFPLVNVVCSQAWPTDPEPYTKCASQIMDSALEGSTTFATLDGKNLQTTRIDSGPFTWTIPSNTNIFGLPADSYAAASDGLWVYLPKGLKPGEYTLHFGGSFPGYYGFQQDITYTLIVV
jgi:hypothetical protein